MSILDKLNNLLQLKKDCVNKTGGTVLVPYRYGVEMNSVSYRIDSRPLWRIKLQSFLYHVIPKFTKIIYEDGKILNLGLHWFVEARIQHLQENAITVEYSDGTSKKIEGTYRYNCQHIFKSNLHILYGVIPFEKMKYFDYKKYSKKNKHYNNPHYISDKFWQSVNKDTYSLKNIVNNIKLFFYMLIAKKGNNRMLICFTINI